MSQVSPYLSTSYELCVHFATSPQRIAILKGFLDFRAELRKQGLTNAVQWLDGSFLENVESRESRAPNDLDLVTVYWGYSRDFQNALVSNFPAFEDGRLSKAHFHLDHYPFDAEDHPLFTARYSSYWIQLFSHNRQGIWKGMLEIPLDTPASDQQALDYLHSVNLGI